jgi:cytochrome c-type biogenesis protein
MEIPFALAFTAGLVATINPCGFAMLPAYLSYYLGMDDEDGSPGVGAGRGLVVAAVVSAGFLVVFGVAGALITLGVQAVVGALPWAAMVVGVGIVGLGVALLRGYELKAALPSFGRAHEGRGLGGVFLFGVSYAIASLSCTLPVFLVVVASSIPQLGFVAGTATFLVYGLGMSTLLLGVTLAIAFGEQALIGWLRRSSRHVNRIAGGVLVLAGLYIVGFWATTLAGDGTTQLAPVVWVERLSSQATNLVADRPLVVALIAGVLVVVATIQVWRSRTRRSAPVDDQVRETRPGVG